MPAPARVAAYRALRLIAAGGVDLGDALAQSRDPLDDVRDRALATDLITGTLRWRGALDYQLAQLLGRRLDRLDPEVLDILRLGAYQLLYLERVPPSAIVNDSVGLTKAARLKSASGLVNAVLRRLAKARGALAWPARPPQLETDRDRQALVQSLAVVHSHPAWLIERWLTRYGPTVTEQWLAFNNRPPAITLSTNRMLCTREELQARLLEDHVRTEPTAIAPHGLRVIDGRPLTSRAFREGACLIQDEASQLIPELVAAIASERVLDACASPGGKTVALAAQVAPDGRVVATDVRARRIRILVATLQRCRTTVARVVHLDDHASFPFAGGSFDRVLVDAPCSGLGTLRRDPDIRWRRQPEELPGLAAMQGALLDRVAPLVREGGRLIYSTCSSEPEENEAVVAGFLARAPDFTRLPLQTLAEVPAAIRAMATPDGSLRTEPGRDGLEAFFAAVLRKGLRDV